MAALQAHAQRRYVDVDQLEVDAAPMVGTMAAVRALWDDLGLQGLFDGAAVALHNATGNPEYERWYRRFGSSRAHT